MNNNIQMAWKLLARVPMQNEFVTFKTKAGEWNILKDVMISIGIRQTWVSLWG